MFFDTSDLKSEEIFLQLTETRNAEPERKWLPAYHFNICLLDGTEIGHCNLRFGHNEKSYICGNIGYDINKQYRGHRYAFKASRLLFRLAKKHDMDYLIISCAPENAASSRTCEILGGKLLEVIDVPKDHDMYAEGYRKVKIFKFNLKDYD